MAPLRFDPEYHEEIEKALAPVRAQNRRYWRVATLGLATVLAGLSWVLSSVAASEETMLAAVVCVSAVWIAGVVSAGMNALFAAVTLNMCAVEWVGRRQLGDHET